MLQILAKTAKTELDFRRGILLFLTEHCKKYISHSKKTIGLIYGLYCRETPFDNITSDSKSIGRDMPQPKGTIPSATYTYF